MTGHLIPNYWTARPDVYGRYVPAVRPTLNELFSPIAKVVLGVLGILLITSSNAPAQSNENPLIETFAVYSKPKAIHHIDVGLEGKSHGDILIFEAIFADENKNMVGRLTGKLITGTLPDSITNSNQTLKDPHELFVVEGIVHQDLSVFSSQFELVSVEL